MSSPVLQTVPLGAQWPTLDPFLFCAHHLDSYPHGNGQLGPDSSLAGRSIGQDFAGVDGWNMYHGSTVPGFPQHPHRGFETVTYVRQGWCDHADSLGARARFGQGDVQWLTAGSGIVHSEMFPLLSTTEPNPLLLFQIWLNLPAASKMVDPYYSMYWADEIPVHTPASGVQVTSIAGSLRKADAHASPSTKLAPPPDSWASAPANQVAILHITFDAGAEWELPAAPPGVNRVLYCFSGETMQVADQEFAAKTGIVLDATASVPLQSPGGAECLLLQGRPIGEPVAQHGPFVMNTADEIQKAFADYQRTGFGGWPWADDGPVHGDVAERWEDRQPADN